MSPNTTRNPRISPDLLIRQDDIALIYLTNDANQNVRIKLGADTELSAQCQVFLAKARIAEAVSTSFLSLENRKRWKLMLGESISLAIAGDLENAKTIAQNAKEFLEDRAGETARMWYVQACLAMIVLLMVAYAVFDISLQYRGAYEPQLTTNSTTSNVVTMDEDDIYTVKYLLLALIAGSVGAVFSVLIRVGRLDIDPAAGWQAHYGEVLFRMTIGGLAGGIIIIGWQAEVFATFMKSDPDIVGDAVMRASQDSFRRDFWKMIILALVAGASERLVPSLLQQLSDRTGSQQPESIDSQSDSSPE